MSLAHCRSAHEAGSDSHLLCDVNRHAEAAALAARLLAAEPGDVPGWLVLARARLLARDPAAALEAALGRWR